MPLFYCPNCNARCIVAKYNTDYIHPCNDLAGEIDTNKLDDVVLIGDLVDSDGTVTPQSATTVLHQGIADADAGERDSIENGRQVLTFTPRGNNSQTTVPRSHFEYIEVPKK